jgi:hypothetical protein
MRFDIGPDINIWATYLPRFLALIGKRRWFKRADQLDDEQKRSPFLWKVVRDYHWFEMAISHESDVFARDGRVAPELVDGATLAALHFIATVVEVHFRLSPKGQRVLEGRLRDCLKAETGFAPVYLEIDVAKQLMSAGYDVIFRDIEGSGRFDLEFSHGAFAGEVECKSISTDAGRQIHRKDFYRFMTRLEPAFARHAGLSRPTVVVMTLRNRLSANDSDQVEIRRDITTLLSEEAPSTLERSTFRLERRLYSECIGEALPNDEQALYAACRKAFGANSHIAGSISPNGGCLIVVRSERDDDTSKPLLEAMRKAASQFSGKRPSFIAVQFQEIEPADLMLPHFRRRMGILSSALFGHFHATHVNAVYFCGFGAVVAAIGQLGIPAFAVANPQSAIAVSPTDAAPFLLHVSDIDFAAAIAVALPAANISSPTI